MVSQSALFNPALGFVSDWHLQWSLQEVPGHDCNCDANIRLFNLRVCRVFPPHRLSLFGQKPRLSEEKQMLQRTYSDVCRHYHHSACHSLLRHTSLGFISWSTFDSGHAYGCNLRSFQGRFERLPLSSLYIWSSLHESGFPRIQHAPLPRK